MVLLVVGRTGQPQNLASAGNQAGRARRATHRAEIYHRATSIKECQRVNITGIQRISHNLSFVVDGCRAAGIATECSQVDQLATAIEKSMGTGIASNLTGGIDRAASALS